MQYLVVSRHNFDDWPISLHKDYTEAVSAALANHGRGGILPGETRSMPTWDVTGYNHTAIVTFDDAGFPCGCEQIGADGLRKAATD